MARTSAPRLPRLWLGKHARPPRPLAPWRRAGAGRRRAERGGGSGGHGRKRTRSGGQPGARHGTRAARRRTLRAWTPHRRHSSCSTARSDDPAALAATCATCGGSTAGSAARRSAPGDRRPRRTPRRADPARRRDRRRGHPGGPPRPRGGERSRGLSIVAIDSRPEVLAAAVPRRPAVAVTPGLELHVGDGRSLPYPDRLVRCRPCLARAPPLEPDEAVALLREMARVARLGVVVNDLERAPARLDRRVADGPPADAATATPATTRRCRCGGAYRRPRWRRCCATAGLTPVRVVRGAFGQRYAIAALPTPAAASRDPPDPQGAGE